MAGLTKVFGRTVAVDGISFAVRRGELLGFLGPNGAGKTTTIAMLLGLVAPTAGTIRVLGLPMPAQRGRILARVNFSSPYVALPYDLEVGENPAHRQPVVGGDSAGQPGEGLPERPGNPVPGRAHGRPRPGGRRHRAGAAAAAAGARHLHRMRRALEGPREQTLHELLETAFEPVQDVHPGASGERLHRGVSPRGRSDETPPPGDGARARGLPGAARE